MKTQTLPSISDAISMILEADPITETRFIDSIKPGQDARQGDIYIVAIAAIPVDAKSTLNRQLAPGSTQGSRHSVDAEVSVFNPANLGRKVTTPCGSAFAGPLLRSDTHILIKHPEHADISLPGGCYQVMGQWDPATDKRVAD